jgi:hypothetical protein
VAWTEVRFRPHWGIAPDAAVTNGVAVVQYFGTNGYLNVWTNGGWLTCSNDVWGQAVPAVATGVFVNVAVYQNFTAQRAAVLVNDRVVVQDLPFLGNFPNYGSLRLFGAGQNSWLDDAFVSNTYAVARHTSDSNGVYGVDAGELQSVGYVARTLYVGTGSGYPLFATIQDALNVWRPRDTIHVYGGVYAGNVTITGNVTFVGQTFTNSGSVTVFAGATLTLNQSANFGTLAATGTVTVGANTLTIGTLTVPAGGSLAFTGGRFYVPSAGVDMTGTFTIDQRWGTQATLPPNFLDDFELYAGGSQFANLGFRGWGASSTGVVVQAGQGLTNSLAAVLPTGTVLSNRIAGAGHAKLWTDVQFRPKRGFAPAVAVTNNRAFLSYVDTNGFLNVWNAGAWAVCSNAFDGSPVQAMTNTAYSRVTVFVNYTTQRAAVFVDGELVRELVPFAAGATVAQYNNFVTQNEGGSTALDNVGVSTNIPAGFPVTDLDNDGTADAVEIETWGSIFVWNGPRTLFMFR